MSQGLNPGLPQQLEVSGNNHYTNHVVNQSAIIPKVHVFYQACCKNTKTALVNCEGQIKALKVSKISFQWTLLIAIFVSLYIM